jgi:hypothetical protein
MADFIVVIVEGPGAGAEYDVAGSVVAGRDPAAAIPLQDPESSREHASITAQEGGAVVEDLGSTNGTFVGEERISGSRVIQPGDRIRIGTTVLELRAGVVTGAPPPPPPGGSPPPPGPPAGGPPPAPEQPSVGVPAPAAGPPAPYAPPSEYPIEVQADFPERIANWRALVQWWLLPIPHWIVLFFVIIAAYFAVIGAFFAILFTRRYPRGIFNFLAGTGRWLQRVTGYYYFTTERYPPFSLGEEPDYPVRAEFSYPEQGIARWRPLVHWLLLIPHYIVLYVLAIVAFICHVAGGFAILFTGRYPRGLFDLIVGYMRWQTRVGAYSVWMTERYPPFTLSS